MRDRWGSRNLVRVEAKATSFGRGSTQPKLTSKMEASRSRDEVAASKAPLRLLTMINDTTGTQGSFWLWVRRTSENLIYDFFGLSDRPNSLLLWLPIKAITIIKQIFERKEKKQSLSLFLGSAKVPCELLDDFTVTVC